MRKLIDKDNNLEWISFDKSAVSFIKDYHEYIRQVNIWSNNEDMKKYISTNPVGTEMDLIFRMINDTDMYFAVHNDEVIALVVLGHTRPIAKESELIKYLKEKSLFNNTIVEDILKEDYLDESQTEEILKNKDNENIYVEYILVNPKYHGRGIATNFYKLLKNNLEFFNGKDTKLLQVSIKEDNIGSRKAVLKNGFRRLKPAESPVYSTYYFHIKQNENTKDII